MLKLVGDEGSNGLQNVTASDEHTEVEAIKMYKLRAVRTWSWKGWS